MGSGGDSVPAPAAWSRSQGCAAVLCCLRASGHHSACYLSVLSHPALPVDKESLDGCQGSPAGSTKAVSLHHLLPMPVEPSCGECPRLCTDRVALAQLLQPPASVYSFLGVVLPTMPNHFHRERTAWSTPLRVPRACSLQFPQQAVCWLSPTSPRAAARSQRAGAHQLPFD